MIEHLFGWKIIEDSKLAEGVHAIEVNKDTMRVSPELMAIFRNMQIESI